MRERKPLVSIVCPAFQEEEVLPLFHLELGTVLDGIEGGYDFEVVYVDDGSADRTLDVIRQIAARDRRVRYVSLSRNFGHQAALTAGLEHARGDAVISMDCDLQHPPAVVPELLDRWRDGCDVVITVRREDRRLGAFKRLTSSAFYRVMALLGDTDVRPGASDFRLLSRRALRGFLRMGERHRFVRGMVQWLGFRAAEVPFDPDVRRAGVSKYTPGRMLRLAGDGLFSFSRVPLRLVTALGLALLAFGAGRAALGGGETGYLAALVLLVGGGILCGLGVVGEYVARIHEQVQGRPLYLVKERSRRPKKKRGYQLADEQPTPRGAAGLR